MITPALTGATVVVTKGFMRNLKATPERYSIYSLQKAVGATSQIVWKVLQPENCILSRWGGGLMLL
jgi:hypothetical protein